jgi:pyruvate carboxylase
MKEIRKLLVANRGEIAIRVFRSAHELGIRTVAIFSHEDRYALHRFKADEAYQVGRVGEPIRAYLDIAGIVEIAKSNGVDAIHPGYGFLSENPDLARACEEAGIIFVGPSIDALERLGDKVSARTIAKQAGAPILSGSDHPLKDAKEAVAIAQKLGFPVMLKAAKGGGGRGMRVVMTAEELPSALDQAQRESQTAFGSSDVFVEKFIQRPRHIEVQLLGDRHGNLIHLHERDCSVQRRHQKVVEIAPSVNLDPELRNAICESAVQIGREVGYYNAGTVEFLLDTDTGKHYFIEVNPRIQVEHTVTEVVTGVDVVRSQLLVAQGFRLDDPEVGLPNQESVRVLGYAIQCRVTTEDPENKFMPDYGRITLYRSSGGMGIRLDAGTAFSGAVVTPYYDSLLVKVTAFGRRFADASRRMERCLQEFRVRGVKTNIPFLINLVTHPEFLAGKCTTRFIDETPELFTISKRKDRATKLFNYLSEVIVNGHPSIKEKPVNVRRAPAPLPQVSAEAPIPPGTRTTFLELGPEKFCKWILDQKRILLTDTTMRDAHQSLLATRLRTYDMLEIADAYARLAPELFSLEMWGGATFDTAMRFMKECPWQRLVDMRAKVPNILFQMLLRASNAVGYSNYPDNVVKAFVDEAASAGIDVFRVFDSLNWVPNMKVAMEAVIGTGALCEAAICYTGDILDPKRTKYDLKYYVELAKELEKMGAHILAIKDMAGLCKPAAAEKLVRALKQEIGIPIHFHTHDTAGIQAGAVMKAAEVGLDIADGALAPLSGLTSQPNLNSMVEMFRYTDRDSGLDAERLDSLARYWDAVREFYAPFETGMMASTAEVYLHEMPGGQVTNLFEQAKAVGLGHRWADICRAYADVNAAIGDIVKVTPSSKAVGDMAILLVSNNMTVADMLDPAREISFPESFVDLISGKMGQPPGGFPKNVCDRVLRGEKPFTGRPGESLPPADLTAATDTVRELMGVEPTKRDVLAHLMFPKVFKEFMEHREAYSDTSILPTPLFFYGLEPGQEAAVDIEQGKTLIMQFLTLGDPHPDGNRVAFFDLNGQPRNVTLRDKSLENKLQVRPKADPLDPTHVGAPMPGMVVAVAVKAGDQVERGAKLVTLEAMKMETTLYAERAGVVRQVNADRGTRVETGDLLVKLE